MQLKWFVANEFFHLLHLSHESRLAYTCQFTLFKTMFKITYLDIRIFLVDSNVASKVNDIQKYIVTFSFHMLMKRLSIQHNFMSISTSYIQGI